MKRILFTLLFLSAGTFLFAQSYLGQPQVSNSVRANAKQIEIVSAKYKQVIYYLLNGYVENINLEEISDASITRILQELDPHSSYIPAKDVQASEEALIGNFFGIGIEYAIISDTLTVQSVVPDGPSEKVGLKPGDKINRIDSMIISGTKLTTDKVIKSLRGKKGSKVRIGYIRKGEPEKEVIIARDRIPLNSVTANYEIRDGIYYIRLSNFGANTYNELIEALSEFTSQKFENNHKFKGLILDLRGNGGGYLSAAERIANEFLSQGEMILFIEGRSVKRVDAVADGKGKLQNIPLAILVDESSASASEIVAGAVQDWDRGVIVGRRTFGKGLVQREYPLIDGSRMRLTIARYHTPSGRVIQSPYTEGNAGEYRANFINRLNSQERFNRDSIMVNDSLKYYTKKKGRIVYGGGGIIPDIFVPIDTSYFSQSYSKVISSGSLIDFVAIYSDNNRNFFEDKFGKFVGTEENKLKVYQNFVNGFEVDDKYLNEFLEYNSKMGNVFEEKDLTKSREILLRNLKGLIVRNLYGLDYYIRYNNKFDTDVRVALDSFDSE